MRDNDLNDKFINALHRKESNRSRLQKRISEILQIEPESVSRRLNGKVRFTVSEMGVLADFFKISMDLMIHNGNISLSLPFSLRSPTKFASIDSLFDMMENGINRVSEIAEEPAELGSVYNTMPLCFFHRFPILRKFMFFKWGYYFVASNEFNRFSSWECPDKFRQISQKAYDTLNSFQYIFFIWDNTLIWLICEEIDNFHRMQVITTEEKNAIKNELKELLGILEDYLKGFKIAGLDFNPNVDFFASNISAGFTGSYYTSGKKSNVVMQTNFTYTRIDDCFESVDHLKAWMNSLRSISTLLSESGRIEKQIFFSKQHKIIDNTLG